MATDLVCKIHECGKPVKARGYCENHYRRELRHGDPLAGPLAAPQAKGAALEWSRKAALYEGDDCLIWPFHRHRATGYGRTNWKGKPAIASRVICEIAHGLPPTPHHQAAHSCRGAHEGCVNPQHLRWATVKENNADKLAHGTHLQGERVGNSKLTGAAVLEIRRRAAAGESQRVIAASFGINQSLVSMIKRRTVWAHLT